MCKGGNGGIGNKVNTKKNKPGVNLKLGIIGEEKEVELELKCISDVCLVGFPNAGKSTLMAAVSKIKYSKINILIIQMTRTMPKIASYEFTTLHPHIGKIIYDDFKEIVVEDLPGLITGAHLNKGLGHRFLKHIERAKLLIFLLDGSNHPDIDRSPVNDFKSLKEELLLYNKSYNDKPFIVVLNKCDVADPEIFEKNKEIIRKQLSGQNIYFLDISAKCGTNVKTLVDLIRHIILDKKY